MRKRLLVAGASGFIGTNFLNRVKDSTSFEIVGVLHKRKPRVEGKNIEYVCADLRNGEDCKRVVKEMDYVCMFAGKVSPMAVLKNNPLGPVTENTVIQTQMLEAAYLSGVKKFLWLSSTTGYPSSNGLLREEDFFDSEPAPPYEAMGWMFRYLEKLSLFYTTKPKNPMTLIVLRPSGVFGEYDDFNFETCHALPALLRRVVERQFPIEVWGTGEEERDWIYVDDLIDACFLALERVEGYEVFNVGSGKTYSLNQLLRTLLDIEGHPGAEVMHRQEKSKDASVRRLNVSRAKVLLGFESKTPIREGLAKTIHWYKTHGARV